MSTKGETLYHPINGSTEDTWDGFSWPGFLFGVIWLAIKQLWVHFIVSLIILMLTAGFAAIPIWLFYGFTGNSAHKKSLLSKGYLSKTQFDQRGNGRIAVKGGIDGFTAPNVADQLTKLAQLRESGILSESEFAEQKAKLLKS